MGYRLPNPRKSNFATEPYQQMLGRGTRPYPGKSDCLILDVVGVSTRHAVHTAARLLDCDASALRRHTVTAILADRAREVQARADAIQGTLRSTAVDLFARRALRWIQTRQGAWVLALGAQHGTLRLRPDGAETWQVMQLRQGVAPVLLGEALPLAYVQGLAEDFARRQRASIPGRAAGYPNGSPTDPDECD